MRILVTASPLGSERISGSAPRLPISKTLFREAISFFPRKCLFHARGNHEPDQRKRGAGPKNRRRPGAFEQPSARRAARKVTERLSRIVDAIAAPRVRVQARFETIAGCAASRILKPAK